MEQKCDNFFDCDDGSDENDCKILQVDKKSYRKEYPPIRGRGVKQHVQVSVTILTLGEFEDITMSYRCKFHLILKWFDKRLTYHNLKKDMYKNNLGKEELEMIWIPPVLFNNTLKIMSYRDNGNPKIHIEKRGKHFVAPPSIIDENFYYLGSHNTLHLQSEHDLILHCNYELLCYPFDTQTCTLEVRKNNNIIDVTV